MDEFQNFGTDFKKPFYSTKKLYALVDDKFLMDRSYFKYNIFLKLYDEAKNDKYGETLVVTELSYDVIHELKKGISSRFGFG
jgi:hypothetical protein